MQLEQPKENLSQFKERVAGIEKRRGMSGSLLKYIYPSLAIAAFFLIISIFQRLNCFWTFIAILFVAVAALAAYMWYQFKMAEEFEEKLRAEKIREMSGRAKCIYLEGYVPDGSGKIGKCVLYRFTLDDHPYCIYCHEYRPKSQTD